MKNTLFYLLLMFLMACGNRNQQPSTSLDTPVDGSKDSCYCNSADNLNLISDSVLAARKELWKQKVKNLYPGMDPALLPSGFKISVTDIASLAELLDAKKYPQPKSVIAYFTFDTPGAADSGKITATFVPVYETGFAPCKKGCKSNQSLSQPDHASNTINIDITQPCPPFCE